jgi:hypothetical protein
MLKGRMGNTGRALEMKRIMPQECALDGTESQSPEIRKN